VPYFSWSKTATPSYLNVFVKVCSDLDSTPHANYKQRAKMKLSTLVVFLGLALIVQHVQAGCFSMPSFASIDT
jgi:hypothetical protein